MSARKRIYMAGSGGMLGEAFYRNFRDEYELKCTDIDVNEPWLSLLDFRRPDDYLEDVERFKPDYLFHLGAHTDLEYCERNPDEAYATNTTAVENAAYIANRLEIPILYISTAGIFNGAKDSFDDWDQPAPIGHYARSKHAGEVFIERNCERYFICRAGWMMGGGPGKDKKFIQKIMRQLRDGKRELFIVNDRLGSPTYTHDFARNTRALVEKSYWGLYNMVCGGVTSRLEVTQELLKITGLADRVRIVEVDSGYWKETYFAPRPASERLVNKKLEIRQLNLMRDWRLCLREYIEEYYPGYLG